MDEPTIPSTDKPKFPMRINQYLALKKNSTRRAMDELIKKKKVLINNRLAVLGDRVKEEDEVKVLFREKE
ncbi:MAG: S4 domain-containing protein [Candidatus Paceibacterota bacterium]|jgi:16S rRNA U516 pseudouridylate synthase RsuA-like enzyme